MNGDTWRYHEEHGAKLIYWHEVEDYEAQGWSDIPFRQPTDEDFVKGREYVLTVEEIDIEDGVTLSDLKRKELLAIAKDKGIKLKRNPRVGDIIEAINGSNNE
jgi:hypothetical protein